MKRICLLFAVLFITTPLTACPGQDDVSHWTPQPEPIPGNILVNGSFDDSSWPPVGWKTLDVDSAGSCAWDMDIVKSHESFDGSVSLKFPSNTLCMVENDYSVYRVPIKEGSLTTITFTYKREPAAIEDSGKLTAYGFWYMENGAPLTTFRDEDGIPARFKIYVDDQGPDRWVEVVREFQVPKGAGYLRILIGKPIINIYSNIYLDRVGVITQ